MQHPKSRRMRFVWVVIFATILQSCGASYHLKRAIAKDPTIMNDTIVKVDTTFVTDEIRLTDTLVVRDTIVREIKKDNAVVRVQKIHDTIRIDVICPPDTIRFVDEIEVERIIYQDKKTTKWYQKVMTILWLVMGIVVVLLVIKLTK